MRENTILPAEQALMMSQCLLDAVDRMPGLSESDRVILLRSAELMGEHSCNAVIADAMTALSLERLGSAKG